MSGGLPVRIIGGGGNGTTAEVTDRGQLITSPIEYDTSYVATMNAVDTAFNLVLPAAERKFVISALVLTGTKSIDQTIDATVEVYESSTLTGVTVLNSLALFSVPRSGLLPIPGLNIITQNASTFINVKTSDATVNCTLMGYYIGHHHEI